MKGRPGKNRPRQHFKVRPFSKLVTLPILCLQLSGEIGPDYKQFQALTCLNLEGRVILPLFRFGFFFPCNKLNQSSRSAKSWQESEEEGVNPFRLLLLLNSPWCETTAWGAELLPKATEAEEPIPFCQLFYWSEWLEMETSSTSTASFTTTHLSGP